MNNYSQVIRVVHLLTLTVKKWCFLAHIIKLFLFRNNTLFHMKKKNSIKLLIDLGTNPGCRVYIPLYLGYLDVISV